MTVFSNVDIMASLGKTIFIEGFDHERLSADSYDVGIEDVWKVTDENAKAEMLEIYWRLGARGLNTEAELPKLSKRQISSHKTGVLRPHEIYIAECDTPVTVGNGVKARAVPKSGRARDGIHAFNPNMDGYLVIVPYTFAQVPEGPVAQVIFYDNPTWPLSITEMEKLYKDGKLIFSSSKFIPDEKDNGHAPMTFTPKLLTYIGGKLTDVGSSDKFRKVPNGNGMFNFYLAMTNEEFGTGSSHILWMLSREGHIYPNAPLVHANVRPQQHTLEVSLDRRDVTRITSGYKRHHACWVRAYPLKTPATKEYHGGYEGQKEPLPRVAEH